MSGVCEGEARSLVLMNYIILDKMMSNLGVRDL